MIILSFQLYEIPHMELIWSRKEDCVIVYPNFVMKSQRNAKARDFLEFQIKCVWLKMNCCRLKVNREVKNDNNDDFKKQ